MNENDIEEQFVQGSGPGGQNVNRLQNCVILKHLPTGIIVKCHQERLLQSNRKLARQLLLQRLDVHYNGTDSIVEQKKRYILSRLEQREQRFSDLRMKKLQYQKIFQQQRQQLFGGHNFEKGKECVLCVCLKKNCSIFLCLFFT